jgi:hypothetical protein
MNPTTASLAALSRGSDSTLAIMPPSMSTSISGIMRANSETARPVASAKSAAYNVMSSRSDRAGRPSRIPDYLDKAEDRQEALIDESVEESFPASDPPSAKRIA